MRRRKEAVTVADEPKIESRLDLLLLNTLSTSLSLQRKGNTSPESSLKPSIKLIEAVCSTKGLLCSVLPFHQHAKEEDIQGEVVKLQLMNQVTLAL